jgi:hypothetical protein
VLTILTAGKMIFFKSKFTFYSSLGIQKDVKTI